MAAILTPACAADPVRGAEINLIGTLNVFEAARRHGIRQVLYMSSAGVFGPDDGVTPRPTTHYGAFKLACEGSARAYWIDNGIASVGFRPLVVYGPGRETGLTAGPTLACKAAARGEPYTIPFSGASDFLFVDDIAAAFTAAAKLRLEGAEAYTLAGIKATVDDIVREIARAAPAARIGAQGPTLPVAAGIVEGEVRHRIPGIPTTSLADGISRTISHYRRKA
jgi:nucleoside-diphosphate-sugar epimerase